MAGIHGLAAHRSGRLCHAHGLSTRDQFDLAARVLESLGWDTEITTVTEVSTNPPHPYNSLQHPTDIVLLFVLWRVRFKLSLRDLAEVFLEGGAE